jgi:hypothetical protein
MSNMSYCRFENTSRDLQDCIDAVEIMLDHKGKNEYGEALYGTEKVAFEEMIELCDNFSNYANTVLEQYGDEMYDDGR